MSLLRSVFVVLALLSVVGAAFGASSFGNNSFTIRVYSDGSAIMTQNLTVVPGAASVDVPLLTPILSNLVATDQNGSPLSFRISGSNITIYTLGATGVTLRYDSLALTNKTGTVWSLVFETRYNATVVLPRLSSLSYVSGTTYTLSVQNGSPVVEVPPGLWQMTYGVSIGSDGSGATTTTPQNGGGPFGLIPYFGGSEFGLVALGAVVMGGGFLLFR
ncbi:MAG: hypothetical protein HY297_02120 [Thaumarchaeota archaeon]|nr:hypothetical protein [Nitrososphaerota archaeon]